MGLDILYIPFDLHMSLVMWVQCDKPPCRARMKTQPEWPLSLGLFFLILTLSHCSNDHKVRFIWKFFVTFKHFISAMIEGYTVKPGKLVSSHWSQSIMRTINLLLYSMVCVPYTKSGFLLSIALQVSCSLVLLLSIEIFSLSSFLVSFPVCAHSHPLLLWFISPQSEQALLTPSCLLRKVFAPFQ